MAAIYTDGNFATESASNAPTFEAPFEHTTALLVLRQTFWQAKASKSALALNTAHASYSDFKLVAEGPETDEGEGVVSWERTYAKVPDTFTELAGEIDYQFIGQSADYGATVEPAVGRHRFNETVLSIEVNEFFLVGSGQTYETPDEIPRTPVQKYVYELAPRSPTNYVVNVPPSNTPTLPTLDEYETMCDNDETDETSYSIVVRCNIERWMGNIYRRRTQRIKAI